MSITAMKQALEALEEGKILQRDRAITTLRTAIKQAEKQEPECPDGYKLVMVEIDAPRNEPDWDECIRQAELSTGIKVERNTLSIIIREVRRWLLSTPPAAPVQEPTKLKPEDVIVETYSTQKGGFVLKPDNGVRLIHKPTGIVVQCASERSQHRNRDQAWRDLERYLYETRPQPAAQRQWVGLTEPELRAVLEKTNHMITNAMHGPFWPELEQACRAIEAKLREKNSSIQKEN